MLDSLISDYDQNREAILKLYQKKQNLETKLENLKNSEKNKA